MVKQTITTTSKNPSSDDSQQVELSNYGATENRTVHPFVSVTVTLLVTILYLASAMLPVILPLLLYLGLYLQVIPLTALKILGTLVVLDYVIPLRDGYRPNRKQKSFIDRMFAEGAQLYFPSRSINVPKQLDPKKAYILAAWPHGLMGGGNHYGMIDFEEKHNIYPIYSGASITLYVPILRRILTTMGYTTVTKAGLSRVLDVQKYGPTFPHNVVHLVVGGIHEMFFTPGYAQHEQIILSKRKGFIKLALTTGADILPMYSFGANQAYYRIAGPDSWLCTISTWLRMSVTPFLGRWWIPFGWLPFRQPILTVTGPVFHVPKVQQQEVTDALVESTHGEFCQALRTLFDTYKKVYVEEMGADPQWLDRELKFEDELCN